MSVDCVDEESVEMAAKREAVIFFDSLLAGRYGDVAEAQDRLRSLGWNLTRVPATPKRPNRRKAAADVTGPGEYAHDRP